MEVFLFGINVGLGYMFMFVVMLFNGGVFVVIVVGFVFGYFFYCSNSFGGDSVCGVM